MWETAEVKLVVKAGLCFRGGCSFVAWLVLLVAVHEGNDVDRDVISRA